MSTAAFDNLEMSVDLASVRLSRGEPLTATLDGYEGFGLVAITAGTARAKSQAVCRAPLASNPAHGLVVGNKSDSVKKFFKNHCDCIVLPA